MPNRAMRRAALRKKAPLPAHRRADPMAGLRALDQSRPYDPGEMLAEHNLTAIAFERLRTGCGTEDDFDRVSMMLNIGLIRAEQIGAPLVQIRHAGQMAFARMKDRYQRGLAFGFDAQGLADVPLAIETYQTIVDASSPKQMVQAIHAAYHRITRGWLLQVKTSNPYGVTTAA